MLLFYALGHIQLFYCHLLRSHRRLAWIARQLQKHNTKGVLCKMKTLQKELKKPSNLVSFWFKRDRRGWILKVTRMACAHSLFLQHLVWIAKYLPLLQVWVLFPLTMIGLVCRHFVFSGNHLIISSKQYKGLLKHSFLTLLSLSVNKS